MHLFLLYFSSIIIRAFSFQLAYTKKGFKELCAFMTPLQKSARKTKTEGTVEISNFKNHVPKNGDYHSNEEHAIKLDIATVRNMVQD
jgi:hypothetical protein